MFGYTGVSSPVLQPWLWLVSGGVVACIHAMWGIIAAGTSSWDLPVTEARLAMRRDGVTE